MYRFIAPIILIVASIAGFFLFTSPLNKEITLLKEKVASYNEALDNARALENERDKLTSKYNSILPQDLDKIEKLLPDNVDNIRLILEIEKIALPYGMTLKNVKYDTLNEKDMSKIGVVQGGEANASSRKDYGTWTLEFSTQGTYVNFLNFLKDLESNLRIVDVAAIDFSSNISSGLNASLAESYKYDFRIKTYWLKN